jgi:restriction system protein
MGRRSGLEGFLSATVRAAAAAERERQRGIRAQLTQARQLERHHRIALAQQSSNDREAQKQAKAQHLEDRHGEVDDLNAELQDRLEDLRGILAHTLALDDRSWRRSCRARPYEKSSANNPCKVQTINQASCHH